MRKECASEECARNVGRCLGLKVEGGQRLEEGGAGLGRERGHEHRVAAHSDRVHSVFPPNERHMLVLLGRLCDCVRVGDCVCGERLDTAGEDHNEKVP
jgi:hypothetical protein